MNSVQYVNGFRQIGIHIVKFKKIQEQRIRGYFIQAAKDILKEEGLKSASVRNIAERAGYSYATLYNYFKDVKELVFECVVDFQEDCRQIVEQQTRHLPRGKEKLKAIIQSYIKYFLKYPGIFDLFFLEKIPRLNPGIQLIFTQLDSLCEEEWDYCINHQQYTLEEQSIKSAQLRYQIAGLLLFYLNRRQPDSRSQLMAVAKQQLDAVLG